MRVGRSDRDRIIGPATSRVRGFDLDPDLGRGLRLGPGEQRVVWSGRACVVGYGTVHGTVHGQQERGTVDGVREGPPIGRAAAEHW